MGPAVSGVHSPNMFGSVTFEPAQQEKRGKEAELIYSPLPRFTGRSLAMGALVSMGGLVFGYVGPPRASLRLPTCEVFRLTTDQFAT